MSEPAAESKQESLEQAPAKKNWKSFFIRIFGSLIILGLLYFFLPRNELIKALNAFSLEMWLAGVACYMCLHLIGVAKWRLLINAAGGDFSFMQAMRCYYYGLFGNTFLPSVVGGDIIRAGLAMRLTNNKSAILMGSLVDRTIDSFGLALVAGIGALLIPMSLDEGSRNIFWGFTGLLTGAVILLILVSIMIPVQRLSWVWRKRLVKIRRSAKLLLRRPDKVLIALIAVVLLQVSQVVMNSWLGRLALIVNVSWLTWLFVWPVAKLSAMSPLTQGGIGVREAVQGVLFVPFGVSMEKAVATGLMFQAIIISGNLLGGLLALIIGRISSMSGQPQVSSTTKASSWPASSAFAFGLLLFFLANTFQFAHGSGVMTGVWFDWLSWIPGYDMSFIGSLVVLVYGVLLGYSIGWLAARLQTA